MGIGSDFDGTSLYVVTVLMCVSTISNISTHNYSSLSVLTTPTTLCNFGNEWMQAIQVKHTVAMSLA